MFARLHPSTIGLPGMSKVAQKMTNPDVDEFDIKASLWTFAAEIAKRIQVQLEHPTAKFQQITRYRSYFLVKQKYRIFFLESK